MSSPLGSYPLWVGSLAPHVGDHHLKSLFGSFRPISSVKIMRNESGESRLFGYVNFLTKDDAERAAKAWNNRSWLGTKLKTKGPIELESRKPLPSGFPSSKTKIDYRPFTDCLYFMEGLECSPKGGNCQYRHNDSARKTSKPCRKWKTRQCVDPDCPYQHKSPTKKPLDVDFSTDSDDSLSSDSSSIRSFGSQESGGRQSRNQRSRRGRRRKRVDSESSTGNDAVGAYEPVGVFWDIENCPVPRGKSVLALVVKIRNKFFVGKKEVEFICVCDSSKEKKEVLEELNAAQVTIVHVNAVSKNAADDKLRQSLRRFAQTNPAPATVILVSGDINFAAELSDFRHRQNLNIILLHNRQATEALKACANKKYCFEDFTASIPDTLENTVAVQQETELLVKNFPPSCDLNKVKNRLSKLSANCGGRVKSVYKGTAVLKFTSMELAVRAKKRMDGEDVFGSKIKITTLPPKQGKKPDAVNMADLPSKPPPTAPAYLPPGPTYMNMTPQGPFRFPHASVPTPPLSMRRPVMPPLAPPLCVRGFKSRIPLLNPPGGVDLTVTGLPKNLTRAKLKAELNILFTKYTRVIHLTFDPPDGSSFERVFVTVESYAAAAKCLKELNHAVVFGCLISIAADSNRAVVLEGTAKMAYTILTTALSSWVPLKIFFNLFKERFKQHCRFSLLDKIPSTVCLDGRPPNLVISLTSRSPRAALKPQDPVAFNRQLILLLQSRGTIDLLSIASEYVSYFHTELPFHEEGEALEDILKSIPGVTFVGIIPDVKVSFDPGAVALGDKTAGSEKMLKLVQELLWLLNSRPGWQLPFAHVAPAYHRRYDKQLKLKGYGVSKMIDLLELPRVSRQIQMTGVGNQRLVVLREREKLHYLKLETLRLLKENCRPRLAATEFVQMYQKTYKKNLVLSDYGVLKFLDLFDTMSDITEVKIENGESFVCLKAPDHLAEVSQNVNEMLKAKEDFSVDLCHFQNEYSSRYDAMIPAATHGFKKLSDLLNFLPDVKLEGSSLTMKVKLNNKLVIFAHKAVQVLKQSPECRLPFCKFVPAFQKTVGYQCKVADYGCAKLMELFRQVSQDLKVVCSDDGSDVVKYVVLSEKEAAEPPVPVASAEAEQTAPVLKTKEDFGAELKELLSICPNGEISVERFIGLYHQHFKRQLKVADFGCSKLCTLLKAVSDVVKVEGAGKTAVVKLLCSEAADSDDGDDDVQVVGSASSSDDEADVKWVAGSVSSSDKEEGEEGEGCLDSSAGASYSKQRSYNLMDFENPATGIIVDFDMSAPALESGDTSFSLMDDPVPEIAATPLVDDPSSSALPQEKTKDDLSAIQVPGVSLIPVESPSAAAGPDSAGPTARSSAPLDDPLPTGLEHALLASQAKGEVKVVEDENEGSLQGTSSCSSLDDGAAPASALSTDTEPVGSSNPLFQSQLCQRFGLVAMAARLSKENRAMCGSDPLTALMEKNAALIASSAAAKEDSCDVNDCAKGNGEPANDDGSSIAAQSGKKVRLAANFQLAAKTNEKEN